MAEKVEDLIPAVLGIKMAQKAHLKKGDICSSEMAGPVWRGRCPRLAGCGCGDHGELKGR